MSVELLKFVAEAGPSRYHLRTRTLHTREKKRRLARKKQFFYGRAAHVKRPKLLARPRLLLGLEVPVLM